MTPLLKGTSKNATSDAETLDDFLKANLGDSKPRLVTAGRSRKESNRIYPLRPSSRSSAHSRTYSTQVTTA